MPNEAPVHLHLYGIRSCDSCRRAMRWLRDREVPHTFHDVREVPLTGNVLRSWLGSAHGPGLLNRRSTAWRQLSEEQKQAVDREPASLILQHPTLLKRPVITDGESIVDVGFEPARLEDRI